MRQEPLAIEDHTGSKNGSRILRLKGPLVISNLFDFQAIVRGNTSPILVLDMSEVPFVDSAGIGTLVGAYVSHQKEGRSLALVGVNDRIRTTMKITHVESFFRIFDSLTAAEAAS